MAALRTIQCEDCGHPRQTSKVNTKYCITCRLLRNIKFIDDAKVKCFMCKQPFAPLRRGEKLCAKCDPIPVFGDPRGTCALCGTADASLIDKEVAVCRECGHDPAKREMLQKSLLQKRLKQMEAQA